MYISLEIIIRQIVEYVFGVYRLILLINTKVQKRIFNLSFENSNNRYCQSTKEKTSLNENETCSVFVFNDYNLRNAKNSFLSFF
jgi:hypothetical protein